MSNQLNLFKFEEPKVKRKDRIHKGDNSLQFYFMHVNC